MGAHLKNIEGILAFIRLDRDQLWTALVAGFLAVFLFWKTIRLFRGTFVQNVVSSSSTLRNELILRGMPSARTYVAPFGFSSPHAQIMGAMLLRMTPDVAFEREDMQSHAGGHVTLDWHGEKTMGKPCLLLLHGLTGGSQEAYMRWMVLAAAQAGLTAVIMNARGCAGSKLTSPRTLSATWTEDVRDTCRHIRSTIGNSTPFFAVGYSLGAGILTKFVAEEGIHCELDGAIAAAAAFDLSLSAQRLEGPFGMLTYTPVLATSLRKYFKRHMHHFTSNSGEQGTINIAAALACKTVRDWDAAVIVPQYGFKDTDEYYATGSTAGRIHEIGIPFLALNAEDDPICPTDGLPQKAFAKNENTISVITPCGGHVAWIENSGVFLPKFTYSWDNRVIVEWLQALIKIQSSHPELFRKR